MDEMIITPEDLLQSYKSNIKPHLDSAGMFDLREAFANISHAFRLNAARFSHYHHYRITLSYAEAILDDLIKDRRPSTIMTSRFEMELGQLCLAVKSGNVGQVR